VAIDAEGDGHSKQPSIIQRRIASPFKLLHILLWSFSAEQRIEVAWTGPGTDAVPLRRVDQVLYELIEAAKSEILLVTYAAYKAARALDALQAATERGVTVGLVIELAQESGGKISFDGSHTIHARVPQANIFYWPPERRTRRREHIEPCM
jgi:hypothetical protein